ncbi:DGQHR domain-containing protein, partial [Methylobacterium sp. D53M]
MPARVLLAVCHSHAARAEMAHGGYTLDGNQRFTQDKRLRQIADYIARSDSAFPNAIILAANSLPADEVGDDQADVEPDAWTVRLDADGLWTVVVPSAARLAAVVDGQHRLFAFTEPAAALHLDMPLICSIYFDLPKPFQAQLFATINSTQKRVDKSLTYELFGYNVAEEAPDTWTPEKLAVFLTRRLNVQDDSPLHGRIIVAPKRGPALDRLSRGIDWQISTAVVVEGLLRLFSANPKRDANRILTSFGQNRLTLSAGPSDRTPLRSYYVNTRDEAIYRTAKNFLEACDELFWKTASRRSFIIKTVGVQALFDVLRIIVPDFLANKNVTTSAFRERLRPAATIDFGSDEFRNASGSGRTAIRRAILERIGA